MQNLEPLLLEKITEFGLYLISVCNDEDKKEMIHKKIMKMNFIEILLFITFFDQSQIDTGIHKLVNDLCIEYNDDVIEKIKNQLEYFIKVKEILNSQD